MATANHRLISVSKGKVASLVWHGDELIDHLGAGGRIWTVDGTERPIRVGWGYKFDRAIASPSGHYTALLHTLGTKGVLLRDGKFVRELNRSFYHADAYEYPAEFIRLADGREVLVHCPDEYNRLEIEDAESGERLSSRTTKSPDFFHSRLAASADGTHLLSAGWYWHPRGELNVYSVDAALRDPSHLDGVGLVGPPKPWAAEVLAAAFLPDNSVVIEGEPTEERYDEGEEDAELLDKGELGRWSLSEGRWLSRVRVDEIIGTMVGVDACVLGLYGHPKLVDVSTGQVVERWPEIRSGKQTSPIIWHQKEDDLAPPIALDRARGRIAISQADGIHVFHLNS